MRLSWVSCGPGAELVWGNEGVPENERGWHGPGERVVRDLVLVPAVLPSPHLEPCIRGQSLLPVPRGSQDLVVRVILRLCQGVRCSCGF